MFSKKIILIFMAIMATVSISHAKDTLYWYLAASMTKPGKEVVKIFNESSSQEFEVSLIVGGSGQLLSRILSSHKGDLYTPASNHFLEKAIQKGIVKDHSILLYQTPVFGLSDKAKSKIKAFNDLGSEGVRIALGKPKTMALGAIYTDIEKKMDGVIKKSIRNNKVVDGINISQIVNYIKSDIVDAGILFDSTAKANGMAYIEIPERYNKKIKVSTAVLTYSTLDKEVDIFLKYLQGSGDIFRKHGFKFAKE